MIVGKTEEKILFELVKFHALTELTLRKKLNAKSSLRTTLKKMINKKLVDFIINKADGVILYSIDEKGKEYVEKGKIIISVEEIVKNKQYKTINGIKVDLYTASVILQVYNSVNKENKKKLRKMSVNQLINVAWKVTGKEKDRLRGL